MELIETIIFCVGISWFIGFFIRSDFSIKNADISKVKKALVIFPHPDDETFTVGGFMQKIPTTVHILTKGERGTPNGTYDKKLKAIRTRELQKVGTILSANTIILDDFGDGKLAIKKTQLTKRIHEVIQSEQPDLIVTYDLSGLYGHPDHIACAEIVTDLVTRRHPHIKLWYATHPKRVLNMMHLPQHMAKNPAFKTYRKEPTVKLFVGTETLSKIRALYVYKSQLDSFKKAYPFPIVPLWFYHSMNVYEYFYEAN